MAEKRRTYFSFGDKRVYPLFDNFITGKERIRGWEGAGEDAPLARLCFN